MVDKEGEPNIQLNQASLDAMFGKGMMTANEKKEMENYTKSGGEE